MVSEKSTEHPIRLPVGPLNDYVGFRNAGSFEKWCDSQIRFLDSFSSQSGPITQALELIYAPYYRCKDILNNKSTNYFETINGVLAEASQNGILVGETSAGRVLSGFREQRSFVAGFLWKIAGRPLSESILEHFLGSEGFHSGYNTAWSFVGYDKLHRDDELTDFYATMTKANQQWIDVSARIDDAKARLQSSSDSFQNALDEFEGQQARIEASYQEALSLDVAKKYWLDKFENHDENAKGELKSFRFWALYGALGVSVLVGLLLSLFACFTPFFDNLAMSIGRLPFGWALASALFVFSPAFLYVWHLRSLYASSKMHRQYAEDAKMRSTMMVVYLALMKQDEKAVTKEERALLLNAILRPIEGMQRDDGPPPGLMDLLTRPQQ